MRVADRPLPPIALDPVPTLAGWPVRPVLAIAGRRPVLAYDTPGLEYDMPGADGLDNEYDEDLVPGFVDATCTWFGLDTSAGEPDDHGNIAAGSLVAQLDNKSGAWSQWNVDGTPSAYGPGGEVLLWAHDASGDDWIFAGVVARWDERGDDTVELEAFDPFSDLAGPIGTYQPGAAGDLPGARIQSILNAAGRGGIRRRLEAGAVTLTAQSTTAAPLEEAQVVAGSDGGVLYTDADGTVVYTGRTWRNGRSDQTVVPVISGNVCTAELVVWDPVISTNDTGLADTVVLENVAKLRAQSPAGALGRLVYTDSGQWTTQLEGDALATQLASMQTRARLSLDSFDVYVLDPRQPAAAAATAWRLFDVVRFVHDAKVAGGVQRVDVALLLVSLAHAITPDGWTITAQTSRVTTFYLSQYWDTAGVYWDASGVVWGF